jgi:hypothetical protein
MWGLLALLAATQPGADLSSEAADRPVPQSFLDCAARFHEALQQSDGARFGCTRALLDSLPGNDGTTIEMNDARITAVDVARRFVEQRLGPEVEGRLREAMAADGNPERATAATISDVIGDGNRYASSSCSIVYDALISGSIRGIAAGNCQVRHMDGLIENLFRIALEVEPGG